MKKGMVILLLGLLCSNGIKAMDEFNEKELRDLGFSEEQIAQEREEWETQMLIQQQIMEEAAQRQRQREKQEEVDLIKFDDDDDSELTQAIAASLKQQQKPSSRNSTPSQPSIDSEDDEFGEFVSGGVAQDLSIGSVRFNPFIFNTMNKNLGQSIGLTSIKTPKQQLPVVVQKKEASPKQSPKTRKKSPKSSPKISRKSSPQPTQKHFLDAQIKDVENRIKDTIWMLERYDKILKGQLETDMPEEEVEFFKVIYEEQLVNQQQELQELQKQKMETQNTKDAQKTYFKSLIADIKGDQGNADTGSAAAASSAACAGPSIPKGYYMDNQCDYEKFLQDQKKESEEKRNFEFENKNVGDRVPAQGNYANQLFQQMVTSQQGAQCGREAMINMHNIVAQFLGKGGLYKAGGFNKKCEWLEVEDFENEWKEEYGKLAGTIIPFIMVDADIEVMGPIDQIGKDFVQYAKVVLNKPGKQALVAFINTVGQRETGKLNEKRFGQKQGITLRGHWFAMAILKDFNNRLTYVVVDSLGWPSNNDRRDNHTVNTIITLLESTIN